MKATNQIVPNKTNNGEKKGFSALINSDASRKMIDKSIGDPQRAASFVSTLISVVNANEKLRECDAGSIISAALRGEVGMGLSVALGEYSIIPYGKTASFQIQVNGLKRLAIRSKKYSDIGIFDVREGEYKGRDPMTRTPRFEWIEDEDERENLPIIGYYGFYKLSKDMNDFFQCVYWPYEKILKHADRYSQAFNLNTYNKLRNGELEPKEVASLQKGSPWYGYPDSDGHMKMCKKTIAKQLLGDGLAPKEIIEVIMADNSTEKTGEPVFYGDEFDMSMVNTDTGEVIEAPVVEAEEPAPTNSTPPATAKSVKKNNDTTTTAKSAFGASEPVVEVQAEEVYADSFFN